MTQTRHGKFTSAAFFDVDETLITVKGMLRFLEFWYQRLGFNQDRFAQARRELASLAAGGSREVANRAYYRLLAGADAVAVATAGRDWFASEQARGGIFTPPVLAALHEHRDANQMVVLVSGSFPACADPVADSVRADLVVCTRPIVEDGVYTGEVLEPVIGLAKARAIRSVIDGYSLNPARCSAYADHASDLPMLECVGNPVVVGLDPVLLTYADQYRWPWLPGGSSAKDPAQYETVLEREAI